MQLNSQEIKRIVREELPGLMKRDESIRQFILDITREQFNGISGKTESRFDRLLEELKQQREEEARRWDKRQQEQDKKL